LAKKLEQEIRQQKVKFGSGTLQPLVKTNIVGVDNVGAFSVVQVSATWDKNQIEVKYSQMGRSWSVPRGQPSPQTEVMLDYYQYKVVGTMLELLGAAAPSAITSGSQPEIMREQRDEMNLCGSFGANRQGGASGGGPDPPVSDLSVVGQAGGPPTDGAGLGEHIAMLKTYIETNQDKFRRRRDEVARIDLSKTVEIDEKGTAVIDEGNLVDYCESLATIFDEEEPGLAKKLEQEIRLQKVTFGSGILQPLVKTNIVGVDNVGAFSVVQVCATWNKNQIEVKYSQMGRSWSVPRGQPSPQTEVMLDYYQYKAAGTMLELLGAAVPSAIPSGSQPEVKC
jgi:hypothetical protein